MRKIFFILIAVLFVITTLNGAFAEEMQAYVNQPITISTACIRNSQLREIANASIIIYDSSGNVVVPKTQEVPAGNGTFSFIYTFTSIGGYNTRETCDFGDFLADGSTLITVLKPGFGSMQVIAQGVSQVNLDSIAKAEWLLLLPNATNQTMNSSIVVNGGQCIVSDISGNLLNMSPLVITTNNRMTASFIANNTNGFNEGSNYEIECNISLSDGMYVNGVKSYVYINSQSSLWQQLLQLIGLAQNTNANVNQTLSISNQTLEIVKGLNNSNIPTKIYEEVPYLVTTQGISGWRGQSYVITTKLLQGSKVLNDSVCDIDINNQKDFTNFVDDQNMDYNSNKNLYYYNVTFNDVGSYDARINCSGGIILNSSIVHDDTRIDINSGLHAIMVK
jgi:hypothetical protein